MAGWDTDGATSVSATDRLREVLLRRLRLLAALRRRRAQRASWAPHVAFPAKAS